ncbi:hypothetical protein [Mycolicibacterium sp. S3B2]|uniref:hypothetical protein n=1 Tax=Mycolicibacterium sp. S3B2 TaxID=3415120 RepID=UPI003C7B5379
MTSGITPGAAQWAEFIRQLGWNSTYSHKRAWFSIYGGRPMLMRTTAAATGTGLERHIARLEADAAERDYRGDLLLVGTAPLVRVRRWLTNDPAGGLIGEPDGDGWKWSAACWVRCDRCHALGIYGELASWDTHPCGHHEGFWHVGDAVAPAVAESWALAAYETAIRRSHHPPERNRA